MKLGKNSFASRLICQSRNHLGKIDQVIGGDSFFPEVNARLFKL
jgi:hypothetical protein